MPRNLAFAIALVLIIVCGAVHGWWSERWHTSGELAEAAAKVEHVPLVLGEWEAKMLDTDAKTFAKAGAQSHWMRRYTNVRTQQSVLAILMCGRPGQMAVPTPELCFQEAEYELDDTPAAAQMRGSGGEDLGTFLTARFLKESGQAADLRLTWGWNNGEGWQVPPNPRWTFRGQSYLYKLYVSRELQSDQDEDGTADLLKRLVASF